MSGGARDGRDDLPGARRRFGAVPGSQTCPELIPCVGAHCDSNLDPWGGCGSRGGVPCGRSRCDGVCGAREACGEAQQHRELIRGGGGGLELFPAPEFVATVLWACGATATVATASRGDGLVATLPGGRGETATSAVEGAEVGDLGGGAVGHGER